MDKDEVTAVQAAAREANLLIERRAFSWTDLFNRFERRCPRTCASPRSSRRSIAKAGMLIAITTISRRVEDLDAFIDQLEGAGGLRDVILAAGQTVEEDGTLRSVIQGYYDRRRAGSRRVAARLIRASDCARRRHRMRRRRRRHAPPARRSPARRTAMKALY